MTTLHPTNTFDVRASVTSWFATKAATLTLPHGVAYTLVEKWPESGITPPAISVIHADISRDLNSLGRVVGDGYGAAAAGLLDASAWVSRNNKNWQMQIAVLQSVIEAVFASAGTIPLNNYLSTPSTPAATSYGVRIIDMKPGETMSDAGNPDIMRSRSLIRYEWTLRTNVE